jgi:hypothetical protein
VLSLHYAALVVLAVHCPVINSWHKTYFDVIYMDLYSISVLGLRCLRIMRSFVPGFLANVFINREKQLYDEFAASPNGELSPASTSVRRATCHIATRMV